MNKQATRDTVLRYVTPMNERIAIDPKVCHGKPCIKGTRIMVSNVLNLLAHGADMDEVLQGYPQLTRDDIYAALAYAESVINDEEIILTA